MTTHPSAVFVVGAGNIGSQLIPLLAALPATAHVGVIDPDHYTPANLAGQRFTPRDIGKPKAQVQAHVLRGARPDLVVTPHVCRFEQVPLGLLRGAVVFSCVDSRAARQSINRAAVALEFLWIDAALSREGAVRARAYLPGHACLECSWGDQDYALLESRAPCAIGAVAAAPTAAPMELGAIAAGLQMALYRRAIGDRAERHAVADRQWLLDVPAGRGFTATYARNAACRLDHAPWSIQVLPPGSVDMSLRDALALADPDEQGGPGAALAAPGTSFVRALRCVKCNTRRRVDSTLATRLAPRHCKQCGLPLTSTALDLDDELDSTASRAVLQAPLARRGFVAGDVIAVRTGSASHHFRLA